MKRKILNEIIVIVVTILILFFVLKENFYASISVIKNINILLFILSLSLYVVVFTLEAIILKKLVCEYKKDYKFKDAFNLSLITRFFNGITPFSTGGRPLQGYELKKSGVRFIHGSNVIVQNFVIFQSSLIIFSTFSLIINAIFNFFTINTFIYKMTLLGFLINVIILLIPLIFSISKNSNKKIINNIINALFKIRLIKDKEKSSKKWEIFFEDYYNAFEDFKEKKDLIIKTILIELLALLVNYSIIICVFHSLGISFNNPLILIIGSNIVFLTGCYVPIPGGSGGIEYAFMGYFSKYVSGGTLSSILIIWRFITYYLPTLIGGIVFNFKRKKY